MFAGHDMITDTRGATARRCKLKVPSIQKKYKSEMSQKQRFRLKTKRMRTLPLAIWLEKKSYEKKVFKYNKITKIS